MRVKGPLALSGKADTVACLLVSRAKAFYCSDNYVRMQHFVRRSTSVPFRRFLGDVRRELMQRLSAALHGTLGSYLRDAFQEGSAGAVACLPIPRA
jgi:hypothetical protein